MKSRKDSAPTEIVARPVPDHGLAIRPSPDKRGSYPRPRDRCPYTTYVESLQSENSRRTMRASLQIIAEVIAGEGVPPQQVPWENLRFQHVKRIRTILVERGYAETTINKHMTALKQVLLNCRRLGLMGSDDCANAMDLKGLKVSRLPAGRAASTQEIETLLSWGGDRPVDHRNRAVFALMAYGGLRRSEVVGLPLSAYEPKEKRLTLIGKGNKERFVPVSAPLQQCLDAWLQVRGNSPGPLICRFDRYGRVFPDKRISPGMVLTLLARAVQKTGLDHLSPHDLRRTLITEALDRGVDAWLVSKMAGHSNPQTTQKYDRRPEKTLQAAIEKAFNPK